jgi:hypothetical protein
MQSENIFTVIKEFSFLAIVNNVISLYLVFVIFCTGVKGTPLSGKESI